jgi:glycosyltransferase involved in cell wall biosynthesis
MKILHLTNTSLDWDYRIIKELNALSKFEELDIYAFGLNISNDESVIIKQNSNKLKIKNINLFSQKIKHLLPKILFYPFFYFEINLVFFMMSIRLKPKIIHCHDSTILFSGYLASKFCNSFLIYDAHELNALRNSPHFVLYFNRIIEKFVWERINLLISVSHSILNFYNFYYSKKEILLIPNCNEFNSIDISSNQYDLRDIYKIDSKTPIFIFIGALIEGRGIDLILETFKDSRLNSKVIFIGYGPLKSKIVEYSKYDNIKYFGALDPENLIKVASTADFGLCLLEPISYSDYLAMPNKFYDYINSGLKLIISDLPELKEATLKYNLGFISKFKALDLYDLIKKIELDFTLERSNKIYIEEFNWEFHSNNLINKYKDIFIQKYE